MLYGIEDLGGTFEQVCEVHKKNNFAMPVAIKCHYGKGHCFVKDVGFCLGMKQARKFNSLTEAYQMADDFREKHPNCWFEIVSAGIC
jgi:hypothetical protein